MTNTSLQGIIDVRSETSMQLIDITSPVAKVVQDNNMVSGICYLYNPHTTAGLTINEGADPDVKRDIIAGLQNMVPMDLGYRHQEGNSPSHIMASLIGSSLTIFIDNSKLILGTWQKIFFAEFDGPRNRKIIYRFLQQ